MAFTSDVYAGTTDRANVDSAEAAAQGGASFSASVSADGRYVAFESQATNLVAGDTNNSWDVFVRDRQLGTTERVSVTSAETQVMDGGSFAPSISADGRYVAFWSDTATLVAGDTNVLVDVFVRDRTAGTTERVSLTTAEAQVLDGDSFNPAISADGRYVAFESYSETLVTGDSNGFVDIFVRDRTLGTTERVSVNSAEVQGTNGDSLNASISSDGRYVAFASDAVGLVTGDSNNNTDVFVRDRTAGTTERVSIDSAEGQADNGVSLSPAINGDGRYVAFESYSTDLVAGDGNGFGDIFVRDRTAGTTERVSLDSAESETSDNDNLSPAISGDGRFVAFFSNSVELVSGDTNGWFDIFVRDRTLGTTARASVNSVGAQAQNGGSVSPAFASNGLHVAFESTANNLVSPDGNTFNDVFVRSFDDDGDLVHENDDNCPNWANPAQNLPTWSVPAGDPDCDGWTTTREQYLGTDPTKHCNATSGANDEPDFWPPDFNDSGQTTLGDLVTFGPTFNKDLGDVGYNQRYDLNADERIRLIDIVMTGPYFNFFCS
jgi:Tol biopolymer transport system component